MDKVGIYLQEEFEGIGVRKGKLCNTKAIGIGESGEWKPMGGGSSIEGKLKGKTQKEKGELIEKIKNELKTEYNINRVEIDIQSIEIGDEFIPISHLQGLSDLTPNPQTLTHKPGEVLVIDFWATWCPPCQEPMKHNQQMLEENLLEWEGKVRIVGLGMDEEAEVLRKQVEEYKCHLVEHYIVLGGFESEGAVCYQVNGIPHCILVGKDGRVQGVGHPVTLKLDVNIPKLLKGEELGDVDAESGAKEPANTESANTAPQSHDLEEVKVEVKEHFTAHKELLGEMVQYMLFLVERENIDLETQKKESSLSMIFTYTGRTDMEVEIKAFIEETKYKFKGKCKFEERGSTKESRKLSFGDKCSKCNAEITNQAQYMCRDCVENIYFCIACGDMKITEGEELKEGEDPIVKDPEVKDPESKDPEPEIKDPEVKDSAKDPAAPEEIKSLSKEEITANLHKLQKKKISELSHEHTLYYISPESYPYMNKVLFGRTTEITLSDPTTHNYIGCDGCGQMSVFKGANRWKCANCRDGDYCQQCFQILRDPKHDDYVKVMESAASTGHKIGHVFIKVPVQGML